MAASDMKELLKHELGDLLYAEQLILKMLGTLTREVKNPEMLNRVQEHIGETEEQIERLRRAFESVGEKAKAEKCEAAIGLKEEHDSFKKDEKPSRALLEAFDLGNSLRVEHYEIAGYRSAIAVATAMGQRDVVALLSESLREEEAMASFIERSSVRSLKGLAAGMDLAAGNAEVVLKADGGSSSRSRSSAAKTAGSRSSGSKSAGRSSGKSNGRSTTSDTGGRSSSSRSSSGGGKSASGGSRSSASKSDGSTASKSSSAGSRSSGSKSSGSRTTASRSAGGSSSRTTADRASPGGSSSRSSSSKSSGGSKSGSSSKSGGSKSGSSSSRSRSSRSGGSSARA